MRNKHVNEHKYYIPFLTVCFGVEHRGRLGFHSAEHMWLMNKQDILYIDIGLFLLTAKSKNVTKKHYGSAFYKQLSMRFKYPTRHHS